MPSSNPKEAGLAKPRTLDERVTELEHWRRSFDGYVTFVRWAAPIAVAIAAVVLAS